MTQTISDINQPRANSSMRYLLYGLYGVQALLGLAVIGTLFGAFIMAFPNGLRDSLMSGLEGSNWSETTSRITIGFFMASLVAIVWFYVLNILRKIVVTIIKGDPFIHDNISRLRRMWVMIAAVEILRIIFNLAFPLHTNTDMTISFKFETWFLVFIFAILSEAFRYGAEMRRDQELTI